MWGTSGKVICIVLGVSYFGWGESKQYSQAQALCQALEGGANLASFVNQDNINKIKESVENIDSSWDYWTGLKYTKSSGIWSFIDGADTTFAVSKVTLPQNVHEDQCVKINGNNGQLSVTHCTEARPCVCQLGQHPKG